MNSKESRLADPANQVAVPDSDDTFKNPITRHQIEVARSAGFRVVDPGPRPFKQVPVIFESDDVDSCRAGPAIWGIKIRNKI
jgi:hypothetical protein